MIKSLVRGFGVLTMLVVAAGLSQPASGEEEATVNAFAVVVGQGESIQTGPKEATFVGVLTGTLFAETEKGPIEVGAILCPATIKIGIEDGTQKGAGSCAITGKDGAQMFADISCTGVYLVGCDGQLKLTGGTKRYEGISGSPSGAACARSRPRPTGARWSAAPASWWPAACAIAFRDSRTPVDRFGRRARAGRRRFWRPSARE